MIQAWVGERDRAKECAEAAGVLAFEAEYLTTVRTLGLRGNEGGRLLLQEVLLRRREELFRFRQRQAEVFEALARLVQDGDLVHRVFLPVLCTHNELHLEPHRAILLSE